MRGLKDYGLDFLTVHGDPHVVRAAVEGKAGSDLKILAVTILTSLDRADLDAALIAPGEVADLVVERAARALAAGADGVIASPQRGRLIRALPEARGKLIVTPGVRPRRRRARRPEAGDDPGRGDSRRRRSHRRRPPDHPRRIAPRRRPRCTSRTARDPAGRRPSAGRGTRPLCLRPIGNIPRTVARTSGAVFRRHFPAAPIAVTFAREPALATDAIPGERRDQEQRRKTGNMANPTIRQHGHRARQRSSTTSGPIPA